MEQKSGNVKCSVIFYASILCFAWFILSFAKLILGDSADASQNYGLGLSLILGIIIAIIDVIEIIKLSKDKGGFISFIKSSIKKENGKDAFHLIIALILSIFPIAVIVGVLAVAVGGSAANTQKNGSGNSSTNVNRSTGSPSGNKTSAQKSSGSSNKEINKIAGDPSNNMQPIPDLVHNTIKEFNKNNAGLSSEEQYEKFKKEYPAMIVNYETFIAHSHKDGYTNEDLKKVAGRSDNKVQGISDLVDKTIKEFSKFNVGLSDEERYEKFKKTNPAMPVNFETFRAHSAIGSMSNDELTKVALRQDNNIKPVSNSVHDSILNFKKKNAGLTTEQQYEKFQKTNPSMTVNLETFRAHKP